MTDIPFGNLLGNFRTFIAALDFVASRILQDVQIFLEEKEVFV